MSCTNFKSFCRIISENGPEINGGLKCQIADIGDKLGKSVVLLWNQTTDSQ